MTMRRIATEEAFTLSIIAAALKEAVRTDDGSSDLPLVRRLYSDDSMAYGDALLAKLLDIGEGRIAEMDANGVDMHLLSLTSPGVQMFAPDEATRLAAIANDALAETIARHPTRFAGLASFAPQQSAVAAKEMERAVRTLGLNGFVVNSHTADRYLDEPDFWPILEAAEALDRPIYIHPRGPSAGLIGPLRGHNLTYAMWGYGIETGTHAMRLIASGIFDRFPRLKIVLGHMGEGIPFWLWRIDFMYNLSVGAGTFPSKPLSLTPSETFRRNVAITTSGVEHDPALRYSIEVVGADNILWAIDHPYQPTPPAVAFMDAATISDEDRHKIYHANAERLFHIPAA